jgi:hypothetical protein
MPPISGRLHSLLEQYIYLFLSYIFGRPARFNVRFKSESAGSHTANTNASPLTTLIVNVDHRDLRPPQSCKRKALLVGVELPTTRRRRRPVRPLNLRGPHRDVWNMRQFLIGESSLIPVKNILDVYPPFHLQIVGITTQMTLFF